MAKEFAKSFYNSKAWKRCRDGYLAKRVGEDGGLCEECHERPGEELHHIKELRLDNVGNADITLNHDNLMWLCKDCHFTKHKEAAFKQLSKRRRILKDGVWFDLEGQPHRQNTYVVYGPPASGKTTYVQEHRETGDLVVDTDLLMQGLSMEERNWQTSNLLNVVLDLRDVLYDCIIRKKVDAKNIWIVGTLPKRQQRNDLIERLHAEPILIMKDRETCKMQAKKDKARKNKILQYALIDKWFEDYQP